MGDRNGSTSRRISCSSLMWVAHIPGLQGVRMVGLTLAVPAPSMKVNGVPPCCQGLPHKIGVVTVFLHMFLLVHTLLHASGSHTVHTHTHTRDYEGDQGQGPGLSHSPEESHLGRSTQCSGLGCRCCPWQPVSGFPGTRSHLKQDSRSLSNPCTYMASGMWSQECGLSTRVS